MASSGIKNVIGDFLYRSFGIVAFFFSIKPTFF